jgi:hypothetical protein
VSRPQNKAPARLFGDTAPGLELHSLMEGNPMRNVRNSAAVRNHHRPGYAERVLVRLYPAARPHARLIAQLQGYRIGGPRDD